MKTTITIASGIHQEKAFQNSCLSAHPGLEDEIDISIAIIPRLPRDVNTPEKAKAYLDSIFSQILGIEGWYAEIQVGYTE